MTGALATIVLVAVAIPILTLWAVRGAIWAMPGLNAGIAFVERHRLSLTIAEAIYWAAILASSFAWETKRIGGVSVSAFFVVAFFDAAIRAFRARRTRSPQAT